MKSDRSDAFWLGIKIAEMVYGHSGDETMSKSQEIRRALSEVATGHLTVYNSPPDDRPIPSHITDPEAIRQFKQLVLNGHSKVLAELNRESMAIAKKLVGELYKLTEHLD